MYILGLTGGIGSGKSAVSDRFAALGIKVVDADIAARVVVEPGKPALQEIAAHFGSQVIDASGALDRAQLRSIVFDNEDERLWLEQLLHPRIGEEIFNGLNAATSDYAILVSPLLIEAKQHLLCDRILLVDVPESVQMQRTMSRDDNSEAQVKAIIAAQASRKTRLEHADDVIENTEGLDTLDAKVNQLHLKYLKLATQKLSASEA